MPLVLPCILPQASIEEETAFLLYTSFFRKSIHPPTKVGGFLVCFDKKCRRKIATSEKVGGGNYNPLKQICLLYKIARNYSFVYCKNASN